MKIGQIGIAVRDLGIAVEFYRGTMGAKLVFQTENVAFFDCAGVRLLLGKEAVTYFDVDDIQAAAGELKLSGVVFEGEPHLVAMLPDREVWMAFFRDPDRNTLALMCETKR